MPSPMIKKFADETGMPEKEVEALWDKAKDIAKENGREEDYAYIVGILKKMLKLEESYKNFQNLLDI
jgi:hypothetical protein